MAPSWDDPARPADFFTLKGVLEALGSQLSTTVDFSPREMPFLHPGRSAVVELGGLEAGWLGEVHPLVCREWDLDAAVGFQIQLAELIAGSSLGLERYEDVTTFPALHQDLAIVVDQAVPAARVRQAVWMAAESSFRAPRCSTSTAASRWGRGARASPCGSSSGRPIARSPTPTWPSPAGDRGGARGDRGGASWLIGESSWRAHRLRGRPGRPARVGAPEPRAGVDQLPQRVGTPLSELYPRYRCR